MKKDRTFIYNRFIDHRNVSDPNKTIIDVFMFDWVTNTQIGGELMNFHYQILNVIRGVEHTVSLFFKDVSKVPIVNQIITSHKKIYIYIYLHISQASFYPKINNLWIPQ